MKAGLFLGVLVAGGLILSPAVATLSESVPITSVTIVAETVPIGGDSIQFEV